MHSSTPATRAGTAVMSTVDGYTRSDIDLPGMPDASIDADKRAAGSFLARYEWDSARGAHRISGDPFPIAN